MRRRREEVLMVSPWRRVAANAGRASSPVLCCQVATRQRLRRTALTREPSPGAVEDSENLVVHSRPNFNGNEIHIAREDDEGKRKGKHWEEMR